MDSYNDFNDVKNIEVVIFFGDSDLFMTPEDDESLLYGYSSAGDNF